MFQKIERNTKYKVIGDCAVRSVQYALNMSYEEAAAIVWPEILLSPRSDPDAKWLAGGVQWPVIVKRCKAKFPHAIEKKIDGENVSDFSKKTKVPCIVATVHTGKDGVKYGHCVAVKDGKWFDVDPESGEYSIVRILTF